MKTLKAMLTGAAIAAALAGVDGAVLGLFFGPDGGAALRWGLVAALGGAALGAVFGLLITRLVLEPPDKK